MRPSPQPARGRPGRQRPPSGIHLRRLLRGPAVWSIRPPSQHSDARPHLLHEVLARRSIR